MSRDDRLDLALLVAAMVAVLIFAAGYSLGRIVEQRSICATFPEVARFMEAGR